MDVRCVCEYVCMCGWVSRLFLFVAWCARAKSVWWSALGLLVPDTMWIRIVDREQTELVAGWLELFNLC
jgi:hypothetical protein